MIADESRSKTRHVFIIGLAQRLRKGHDRQMTEVCKQPPGVTAPVIDRARCDAKADCVVICPYNVFELGILPEEDRAGLPFMAKAKGFISGWKQSFAVNADACRACGLCVAACPEKAIRLERH